MKYLIAGWRGKMNHNVKVSLLLITIRELAIYLTEEEISAIGLVLIRATKRMEKNLKK